MKFVISSNRNANGNKSPEGEMVYARKALPPVRLKAPPGNQPEQPESIDQLKKEISCIKKLMTDFEKKINTSFYKGKTKHSGFHYLNAGEWFQFIEIHFRHHLRQKKRIDKYLNSIIAAS